MDNKLCIYYGDRDDLSYDKQEHVFPAGLGGNTMLDKGVVSDQANWMFSQMEGKLMHESIISIERMFFGPGKRGSLSEKNASKSLVNVGIQDDGSIAMCYTALGHSYIIPQVFVQGKMVCYHFPQENMNPVQEYERLMRRLSKFKGKFSFLQSVDVPKDAVIIGEDDGIIYVALNGERPSKEKVQLLIMALQSEWKMHGSEEQEHRIQQNHRFMESPEIARMYAKVAINALAYLKGSTFAAHDNFADIRRWILTGESDKEYFHLPLLANEPDEAIMGIVPPKAHWCLFVVVDAHLLAEVCFYNRVKRVFDLGEAPDKRMWPVGFICDWQNEKEYTLEQLIHQLVVVNRPDYGE